MSYFTVLAQLKAVHRLQAKGISSNARREALRRYEGALVAALHKLKN